ncbi:glycosyltransferase [Acuticoccus sp.]|uniref:glycosyltransferase n=1 Tax=Acuticoccus sp. TaxID=1904378 RepID=UPI003B52E22F
MWPAIDEPFGFAFLEAQAAGLPVVGGAAPGVAEVVRDGETGWLVPPRDAAAHAAAILSALADPERLAAMGRRAAAFARANDLEAGARRLDALLAHAIEHRRARAGEGARCRAR